MKLLLDENLSRRLVPQIEDLFPNSVHVSSVGLLQASDEDIWAYARQNAFALLSAYGDFYEMAITQGPPPKVIWLRQCDYPSAIVEEILRREAIRIFDFLSEMESAVLVLKRART